MSNIRRIAVLVGLLILLVDIGSAATLTVNASGGADYLKIQDAIDNATAGDTILVQSGTYYENVNVNKQLILRGVEIDGSKPVVDASGNRNVITINANGIMLEGFMAIHSGGDWGQAGIMVTSNNNTILNNFVSNNNAGITLSSNSNNTIKDNIAEFNGGFGIYLGGSSYNLLDNNTATNNGGNHGIYISYSSYNLLTNNTASNNRVGIITQGWSSNNNTLINNKALNNAYAGFFIEGSNNFSNNLATNNNYGFLLLSNNNILTGNIANLNSYGIRIQSSDNIVTNNLFNNYNNYDTIYNNKWNVTKKLGTNIIGGSNLGGNFWANPSGTGFSQTCINTDGDGICDSPYVLDANNTDYLPLTSLNILPAKRFINGTVKDNSTGNNLTGVTVTANSTLTTTSNATGFYTFAVTEGTYNLTATYDITYYTNTTMVSTVGQAVVWQDIELLKKPTGNITGSVKSV